MIVRMETPSEVDLLLSVSRPPPPRDDHGPCRRRRSQRRSKRRSVDATTRHRGGRQRGPRRRGGTRARAAPAPPAGVGGRGAPPAMPPAPPVTPATPAPPPPAARPPEAVDQDALAGRGDPSDREIRRWPRRRPLPSRNLRKPSRSCGAAAACAVVLRAACARRRRSARRRSRRRLGRRRRRGRRRGRVHVRRRRPVLPLLGGGARGPGLYRLGLIDLLREWNLAKRLERWAKIVLKGRCAEESATGCPPSTRLLRVPVRRAPAASSLCSASRRRVRDLWHRTSAPGRSHGAQE